MQLLDQLAGRSRSIAVIYVLILMDLAFMGLHFSHHFTTLFPDIRFSLERDRGYSELFQYGQTWLIAGFLGWLAVRRRSPLLSIWSGIFTLLLVDDALMLHETSSAALAEGLALPEFLGLPSAAYSKFFIYAGVGLLAFGASLIGYFCDRDAVARQTTLCLVLSIIGLVCFGGLVDMYFLVAQQLNDLQAGTWAYESIAALAEGGELLVMSITLWFTWQLFQAFGPKARTGKRSIL
jgi:hypothetical protein